VIASEGGGRGSFHDVFIRSPFIKTIQKKITSVLVIRCVFANFVYYMFAKNYEDWLTKSTNLRTRGGAKGQTPPVTYWVNMN